MGLTTKRTLEILAVIVVVILATTAITVFLAPYFDPSKNLWIMKLLELKTLALIVYFVYAVISVIFIPLPTLPLDILAAGLYGVPLALTVRIAAALVADSIAYILAYRFGPPFLTRLVNPKTLQEFEHYSFKHGFKTFLVLSLLPVFNLDVIAYQAGLTKVSFVPFLLVMFVANLYRVAITMLYGRHIFSVLGL